eukprot:188696-Pelagomonas_calceolata.AAC.1
MVTRHRLCSAAGMRWSGCILDEMASVWKKLLKTWDLNRSSWALLTVSKLAAASNFPCMFRYVPAVGSKVLEHVGLSVHKLLLNNGVGAIDTLCAWGEADLHKLVAAFLAARFPILLALNKPTRLALPRPRRGEARGGSLADWVYPSWQRVSPSFQVVHLKCPIYPLGFLDNEKGVAWRTLLSDPKGNASTWQCDGVGDQG